MARAWIGTSGWTYVSWWETFYPRGVAARDRLEHYASVFDTVELNASYYRWPKDAAFTSWRTRLSDGFAFTVKAPRPLTHGARLHRPEKWIEICTRGLRLLGDRLGIFLVQLPPDMQRDDARIDYFLGALPPEFRVAVEFRHPSWECEEVYAILERHDAAYVVMSGAGLACTLRATAPFVYVRMHGPDDQHLYGGSYDGAAMGWWADRMVEWTAQGRDVFAYFNNDANAYAVANATTLRYAVAARGGWG